MIPSTKDQESFKEQEKQWIKERISGTLKEPFFFTRDTLVISRNDLGNLYKRLALRIWTDKDGQARVWYHKIRVYHNKEEYAWMRILQ